MKNNKGFTLIELMIVIAIIAIIAAIAIPNLMASRVRANEAAAISAIKQIATAQVTYQGARHGRAGKTTGGNSGFADNYRNLAFSEPNGGTSATDELLLVSAAVGNASIDADGGGTTTTVGGPSCVAAGAEPYQGYLFSNDDEADYHFDFACYAIPAMSATTGDNAYWVGQQGTVFIQGLAPRTAAATLNAAANDTPQTATGLALWETM